MHSSKTFSSSKKNKPVEITLRFDPQRVLVILEIIALVLSTVSLSIQALVYLAGSQKAAWFIPLVDVDHELSIPSIFSSLLYCTIGIVLILISKMKLQDRDIFRRYWLFLSFIFLFLCFDEGASIHELASAPVEKLMGGSNLPGFMQYAWVIPGLALVLLVAALYLRFLVSLPRRTRIMLIDAGSIYFGGLLGIETLGAVYAGVHGMKNLTYNIFVTIEECMEMSGLILILYALLDYVKSTYTTLRIRLQG